MPQDTLASSSDRGPTNFVNPMYDQLGDTMQPGTSADDGSGGSSPTASSISIKDISMSPEPSASPISERKFRLPAWSGASSPILEKKAQLKSFLSKLKARGAQGEAQPSSSTSSSPVEPGQSSGSRTQNGVSEGTSKTGGFRPTTQETENDTAALVEEDNY